MRLGATLRHRAGQEHGCGARVVRAGRDVAAAGACHVRMREAADDVDAIAERLERLQDLGEREAGALRRRRPLVHRRAVRDVEARRSAIFGAAAAPASGVCAPTIESSSGSATVAPTPCRNVRRDRCFFVMNISLLLGRGLGLHLERRALHDRHDERREPVPIAAPPRA